jgi:hypothetical protein
MAPFLFGFKKKKKLINKKDRKSFGEIRGESREYGSFTTEMSHIKNSRKNPPIWFIPDFSP